jgi:hypothetical protein
MSEIADSIIMLTGAEYRKMMAEIAASNHFAVKYLAHIDEQNVEVARLTAENERLRAVLEKAEGGFYNMANAIDDYDYHGPAPQCTGDIIGHREQFHRVHVEQLVKYAEECRAALSGDKQ